MRRYAIPFALLSLLLPITVFSQSRTPEAALNHFKDALKKGGKGDFDGAIEEYTRAITLSSHFNTSKSPDSRLGNSLTDYSAESVTVIDPFTANAYNNRGLARFRKNDFTGAIEDFNQALKIRPGVGDIYMNRAAALRANGDLQAALKDLDRRVDVAERAEDDRVELRLRIRRRLSCICRNRCGPTPAAARNCRCRRTRCKRCSMISSERDPRCIATCAMRPVPCGGI